MINKLKSNNQNGKQKLTLILLLLLVIIVIGFLPKIVSEPWIVETSQTAASEASNTSVSPSTAAEKTKYRQDAQLLLADIIRLRDDLGNQAVELWAGLRFEQALLAIEQGDQQYGNGDYKQSIVSYQKALDDLNALNTQSATTLDAAKEASFAAIERAASTADFTIATDNALLAMAIDPEDKIAQTLVQRAARLPEIMVLLEEAAILTQENNLDKAKSLYEQTLDIDSVHLKTQNALRSVKQQIIDKNFTGLMSEGFNALDNEQFSEARLKFRQAKTLFPAELSAENALTQVDGQESQKLVSESMRLANQFESEENWQQALTIYDQLLVTDASLINAKVRRISVSVRATLNNQIEEILKAPLALSSSDIYQSAQRVLADAKNIPDAGPVLTSQIRQLEKVLTASQIQITVTIQSDGLTDVVIYRVGNLNRFVETTVLLKPGNYVAAGKRQGYRDVRAQFTVGSQSAADAIVVICTDSI